MWTILIPSVLVPFLATLVMTGIESLTQRIRFWEKVANVGWDLCILGVGVTGGIFVNPAVQSVLGVTNALLAAIIVILVNLGLGVTVLHLKRIADPVSDRVGTICLVAGCLAVGIPSGLTFIR